MLKLLRRILPERPIALGEAVAVSVNHDGFQYLVAGIVTRLYGEGMAEVCVLRAPNAPQYHRMRVLTRKEMQNFTTGDKVAWRV